MSAQNIAAGLARGVAEKFVGELLPLCTRIEIVGSLRRKKPMVHDIDIVALPTNVVELDQALAGLVGRGSLSAVRNGEQIKNFIATKTGVSIDLYVATPETFITLMLIRTGSKEHNIKLAMRARELGMRLRASGDGIEDKSGQLINVDTEERIFEVLQLPFVLPENRK